MSWALTRKRLTIQQKSIVKGSRIQGRFEKHQIVWLGENRVEKRKSSVKGWERKIEPDHGRP